VLKEVGSSEIMVVLAFLFLLQLQMTWCVNAASIISTIAGTGTASYSGDNGKATSATLNWPHGIDIDSSGNVFIGDGANYRVRKITASTGIITTYAGNGESSYSGDGGIASSAAITFPHQLSLDSSGTNYIYATVLWDIL